MTRYKTANESKQEYIEIMGEPLGKLFNALWQEVAWLYTKWGEYVTLYGDKPSRFDLMNKAAPRFFRIIQDVLWEDTLLHIARLTGPQKSAGKDNLSIQRLPQLVKDGKLRQELIINIEIAKSESKFCQDWRNRHIAHRDLELSIDDDAKPLLPASRKAVKESLSSISAVLDLITVHYQKSTTSFDVQFGYGGAESLLYIIDDGLKADEERSVRLKSGKHIDSDFQKRDI